MKTDTFTKLWPGTPLGEWAIPAPPKKLKGRARDTSPWIVLAFMAKVADDGPDYQTWSKGRFNYSNGKWYAFTSGRYREVTPMWMMLLPVLPDPEFGHIETLQPGEEYQRYPKCLIQESFETIGD